ncbi:ribosomal protein L4 [Capsaspora owczarzaki ATCC 30864]|uniref:Ribosomal protein L4 n=1 Tax=Capsaspora owczarzaki (strain ATCC 30864) TaxID=595528 RepID=A0A0D2WI08_CAPO3|nr:ribosomal protein L4 [Capsaspora owczarzaki ATCC 30864]KJE89390.1 ribosomal protein L4 [Capsaspora owczarzaki ATCC 30864]|eukprot:XP_004365739.1 ribosomal protein L4 [Capsaspora owczarzaki ATCC 30864]
MSARPLVQVFSHEAANTKVASVALPAVFKAPIRPDVVTSVHTSMNKNHRQAYAVSEYAGHQTSAISWGTGRAVARIPRVSGGGTHRAGQGAYGNMCRGGRMFAPTKTWRKWHRKINVNQRRFATCSALAASAIPSLVFARGHKIDGINEVPLVVANGVEALNKTKAAVAFLKLVGAYADVEKVKESRKVRTGQGKMRNRRHVQRLGPMIVYRNDNGITRAFRNIPGVELIQVDRLNLLKLAPGGHLGRFLIWTQAAFERLDALYGTGRKASALKKDYNLPQATMVNADLARLINSDEVQSAVRPVQANARRASLKKNPLKNTETLVRLNPYAQTVKRTATIFAEKRKAAKAALLAARRPGAPAPAANPKAAALKAANKAQAKKLAAASRARGVVIRA